LLARFFLATSRLFQKGWLGDGVLQRGLGFAALTILSAGLAAGTWWTREVAWKNANRISNPLMPPETMDSEGDGSQGKFFPSSRRPKHGGNIPSKYFMKSDACQRCHADIYKQWDSSNAPFLLLQQPVVPEKHRVHAGRCRRAFVQVVRRLP